MQTLDFVSGLHNCLATPLVVISGYANTENVFYCLNGTEQLWLNQGHFAAHLSDDTYDLQGWSISKTFLWIKISLIQSKRLAHVKLVNCKNREDVDSTKRRITLNANLINTLISEVFLPKSLIFLDPIFLILIGETCTITSCSTEMSAKEQKWLPAGGKATEETVSKYAVFVPSS